MNTRVESALRPQPASTSGRMAATTKNNWRGKYLRALNIMAPEVDVRRKLVVSSTGGATTAAKPRSQQPRRTRSYRAGLDGDDALQARGNRYQVARNSAAVSRHSLAAQHTISTEPSNNKSAYGFALKPELARGRRCHTDPIEDKVGSAPIQIPTSTTMADAALMRKEYQTGKLSEITATRNNRSAKHLKRSIPSSSNQEIHKSHGSRSKVFDNGGLPWEQPETTMVTPAPEWSLDKVGGLDIAFDSMAITSASVANSRRNQLQLQDELNGLICDEFVETEDEEEDEDDEDGDHDDGEVSEDDQIFEMEDFDSSSQDDNNSNQASNNKYNSSYIRGARTKVRRPRTASESLAIRPRGPSTAAMHRFHSVRQMRTDGGLDLLPESFVPPHQMVQRRDCFSMGLRDEFKKRRPAKI
uniref:Uncharacterized protein n=1 Tax=Globisporangium ultimum (strain ATCC 200006 / CBS 805.95 / DAOM BR144) TaxID=431595 RepID=K3X9B1_GLOUD